MRRRGFSLIEMCVLIVVVSAMAALVLPNIVSMQTAANKRKAYQAVRRLAIRAHEDAIASGQVRELTFEDPAGRLTLNREVPQEEPGTVTGRATPTPLVPSDDQIEPIASATLPDGVEAQQFQQEGQPTNAASWRIRFYPDGRSDSGGFEMREGETIRSLAFLPDGRIVYQEGALPDTSQSRWQAGNLETRTTEGGGTTP